METLKVVIVDDEWSAAELLTLLIQRFCHDLHVVGIANSVHEAIDIIPKLKPDVIFLDIQMADGTGFDVLEALPAKNFETVFVTAYSHYAVQALKYSAVEFVSKPIDKESLLDVVEKVKRPKGIPDELSRRYTVLFENLTNELPKRLCLFSHDQYEYVDIDDVLYFSAQDDTVVAHMTNGDEIQTEKDIAHYEDVLENRNYYRFTRDLLISCKQIKDMGDDWILLADGSKIEIPALSIFEFKVNKGAQLC